MLKTPTTLILGAGASFDLNFPLGEDLKQRVKHECDEYLRTQHQPWNRVFAQSEFSGVDPRLVDGAARVLSSGLTATKSVDDFIFRCASQPMVVKLSKLMTAKIILEGEQNAVELVDRAFQQVPFYLEAESKRRYWLHSLLEHATEGIDGASLGERLAESMRHLRIVTFNYDRSVEHFYSAFLERAFNIDAKTALELTSKTLSIFHVYGSVDTEAPDRHKPNSRASARQIIEASGSIRTIGEALSDTAALDRAKLWIRTANNLLFVGNSYIDQNVEIVADHNPQHVIYGSAIGLSPQYIHRTKSLLAQRYSYSACEMNDRWTAWSMINDLVGIL